MTSGSSADTTMTFGEVAMPAAGESTSEDAQAISVDSTSTEEEKRPSNQSAASSSKPRTTSLPKTSSQTRSSSTGQSTKSGERRPSKSVMQSIKKMKDREPLSRARLLYAQSEVESSNDERHAARRQAWRPACICSNTRFRQGQGDHFL